MKHFMRSRETCDMEEVVGALRMNGNMREGKES